MDAQLFDRIYETVAAKEATYDGVFYTGVRTTGIVCRPSCRARTPKRENVTFYPSLEAAVRDGFRPCKRCRPEENGRLSPDAALAAQVDAIIRVRFAEHLTLKELAGSLAVSPFHLQRTYTRVTGRSPAAALDEVRLGWAKQCLAQSEMEVRAVAESAGFRGASHFSAWFRERTGFTPGDYRRQHKEG
ncbi:bifunctional transcriptional activator/DNA repair enzyme AdaA [Paenibacillus sp. CN-4]|uniref:bifunctional transcriptional activator/DNA repair enzyme AdaA n=1 Tax=Paenibacillus nanchangensis TaxID=3348343 RepID=UPI00397E90DE